MLTKIEELVNLGFNFECGAHKDADGFYAIFDRRWPPEPGVYCRSSDLNVAMQNAYDQARSWLN